MSGSAYPGQIYPGEYALAAPQAQSGSVQYTNPYGERAQHKPLYIKWDQQDDLPVIVTPPAFDEDWWQPPVTLAARIQTPTWGESEDFPVRSVFDEIEHVPFTQPALRVGEPPQANDDFPVAAAAFALDESDWSAPFYQKPIVIQPWVVEEEFPVPVSAVPGPDLGAPFPQRARHTTNFIRWDQNDDLPVTVTAAAFEDGEQPFVTSRVPVQIFPQSDDDLPVVSALDESELQPAVPKSLPVHSVQQTDDELPITPGAVIVEENEWNAPFYSKTIIVQPWPVEDDFPTFFSVTPGPSLGAPFPQRLRHTTTFVRWAPHDDLPAPVAAAVPDEIEGPDFPPKIREAEGIMWATDEEIVPPRALDEADWVSPAPVIPVPRVVYLPDEQIPSLTIFGVPEEFYWQHFAPRQIPPFAPLSTADDDIVPQPVPISVEEEYWLIFPPSRSVSQAHIFELVSFEEDVPVLTPPAVARALEWLVRARRRGIR